MHARRRYLALLALSPLTNAVSLSDMTPRATGLQSGCNAVYTSQIWGCSPSDFQSQECSSQCIGALYGVAEAIKHACSGQGITGQNLVVAFLAGVGPQQLCHNAGSGGATTSPSPTTSEEPSIISSTTRARRPTNTETTLIIDTSSASSQAILPHRTQKTTEKAHTPSPATHTSAHSSRTTIVVVPTSDTPLASSTSTSSVASTTATAVGSSQTNLEDHSGGGSPFDTPGNMNSASSVAISAASILLSAAAAMFAAFR